VCARVRWVRACMRAYVRIHIRTPVNRLSVDVSATLRGGAARPVRVAVEGAASEQPQSAHSRRRVLPGRVPHLRGGD